jgi:CheY-like chemotaxis protein
MQVICSKIGDIVVVGTAGDGGAALRLADALAPDLILLDMTMPEVDGLSVARRLASKNQSPAIVFVTAPDKRGDIADFVLSVYAASRGGSRPESRQEYGCSASW